MAIEIKENFRVSAPVEKVWKLLLNPANLVACMPGASLGEILDDKRFVGSVRVKIGPITAQYQGTITFQEIDHAGFRTKMLAEANERGGGTAAGTIVTTLLSLPEGGTEVRSAASIDITGRILQVGHGLIEGVSAQIIKKYVANAKALIEAPDASEEAQPNAPAGAAAARVTPAKEDSINIFAILWKTLWAGVGHMFARLFGRR